MSEYKSLYNEFTGDFNTLTADSITVDSLNSEYVYVDVIEPFTLSGSVVVSGYDVAATFNEHEHSLSSGVYNGGLLSVASATTFSISDGAGIIVQNVLNPHVITPITWTGLLNITATYVNTALISFISIDSAGAVIQSTSRPTNAETRTQIYLGVLVHTTLGVLSGVNQQQQFINAPALQLRDLIEGLGPIISIDGNTITGNTGALTFTKSAGSVLAYGANYYNSPLNPHRLALSAVNTTSTAIEYRMIDGTNYYTSDIPGLVDPAYYESGGIRVAVPTNRYTVQRVFLFTSNNIKLQYGQTVYQSLAAAKDNFRNDPFTVEASIKSNGVLIAYIIIKQGTTSLTSATDCFIIQCSKFEGTSSSAGGTTLQLSYDNSSTPEILTDTTRGALTLKRGSASDSDAVLEVLDGSGVKCYSATGNDVYFNKLSTGVLHSSASGLITSSKIIDSDISGKLSYSVLELSGMIKNIDIEPAAGIVDSKLAQITTSGKVNNSATSATTASISGAIICRDYSGNFNAGLMTGTSTHVNVSWLTGAGSNTYVIPLLPGVGTSQNISTYSNFNLAISGGLSTLNATYFDGQALNAKSLSFTGATTANQEFIIPFCSGLMTTTNDCSRIYGCSGFTFNPYTKTINANISGATSQADNVDCDNATSNNDNYNLMFGSCNGSYVKPLYSQYITANPSSSTITATTFAGNATTATTATNALYANISLNESGVLPQYLTFTDASGGYRPTWVDTALTYTPSTNTITANISGTATSTTNSTYSTYATNIDTNVGGAATNYILFGESQTGYINAKNRGDLTYNATSATLTTGTVVASLSGLASSSSAVNISSVSAATSYLCLSDGLSGNQPIRTDTGLLANTTTNTLLCNISGSLLGSLSGFGYLSGTHTGLTYGTCSGTLYGQHYGTISGLTYGTCSGTLYGQHYGALSGTVNIQNGTNTLNYLLFGVSGPGDSPIKFNYALGYNGLSGILNCDFIDAKTTTTQAAGDNSLKIASTAYVDRFWTTSIVLPLALFPNPSITGTDFTNTGYAYNNGTLSGSTGSLTFTAPTAGTYTFVGNMGRGANYGVATLYINGISGSTFEGYNSTTTIGTWKKTGLTLSGGTNTIEIKSIAKNGASSQYYITGESNVYLIRTS